jgi:creatinine amidohydrolase
MSVESSIADLRERIDRVRHELGDFARRKAEAKLLDDPPRATSFAVTGVGGSDAPARLLVSALEARGIPARFLPLSCFVEGRVHARPHEGLCIFSQGLSANACIAVTKSAEFFEAFLFTSTTPADSRDVAAFVSRGGRVILLPPRESEPGLLRVVGPPIAMLAGALFAHEAAKGEPRASLSSGLAASLERARANAQKAIEGLDPAFLKADLAFVTTGHAHSLATGLAIKWLEGLRVAEPPAWDVIAVAHGPFHAFYNEKRLLLALGEPSKLFDRLESMLAPERHVLVRIPTELPLPFARLEVEVAVNELFFAAFREAPVDLFEWPSKGLDGALYGMCAPPSSRLGG